MTAERIVSDSACDGEDDMDEWEYISNRSMPSLETVASDSDSNSLESASDSE